MRSSWKWTFLSGHWPIKREPCSCHSLFYATTVAITARGSTYGLSSWILLALGTLTPALFCLSSASRWREKWSLTSPNLSRVPGLLPPHKESAKPVKNGWKGFIVRMVLLDEMLYVETKSNQSIIVLHWILSTQVGTALCKNVC